jgi:hypothetical protein
MPPCLAKMPGFLIGPCFAVKITVRLSELPTLQLANFQVDKSKVVFVNQTYILCISRVGTR